MTRQEGHDIEMIVGELKGTLNALVRGVEMSNSESIKSRAQVYTKLEETTTAIRSLENHITRVDKRLERVEPIADDVQKWKERGIGALMFIGAVSGAFGVMGAMAYRYIATKLGLN